MMKLPSDEQRILEGIVNFGNTDTREVMCPSHGYVRSYQTLLLLKKLFQ